MRALAHDAEVARRRQRRAAADAVFLDGADRDLLDPLPRVAQLRPDAHHVAAFEQAVGAAAVHARDLSDRRPP